MATTIIDPEQVAAKRAEILDQMEKETQLRVRRAETPAEQQALAEMRQVIQRTREEWAAAGLVAA